MTYYRQRNPMSLPFVKKEPTYFGPRYVPLYGSKYPLSMSIPAYEASRWAPPRPLPYTSTKYQPRRVSVCPEPTAPKYPEVNLTRKLARASLRSPRPSMIYSGMTKGRHGTVAKGPETCTNRVLLPRMTKGPVIYSTKTPEPYVTNDRLPSATKDPVPFSTNNVKPSETKVPLPRMTKGPVIYATKGEQPYVNNSSQVRGTRGILSRAAKQALLHMKKRTLLRANKGPRLISTKVPRLGMMKPSRLWLNKFSHSQPSLAKVSQPDLAKDSRVSLAKGSQPSLDAFSPSRKLTKNVKIASTGKKYCSATKWF